MSLKRVVDKKKILGCHYKVEKWLFNLLMFHKKAGLWKTS